MTKAENILHNLKLQEIRQSTMRHATMQMRKEPITSSPMMDVAPNSDGSNLPAVAPASSSIPERTSH